MMMLRAAGGLMRSSSVAMPASSLPWDAPGDGLLAGHLLDGAGRADTNGERRRHLMPSRDRIEELGAEKRPSPMIPVDRSSGSGAGRFF